jgi:hypothetical protein
MVTGRMVTGRGTVGAHCVRPIPRTNGRTQSAPTVGAHGVRPKG